MTTDFISRLKQNRLKFPLDPPIAILFSIPLAIAVVVILETLCVPFSTFTDTPKHLYRIMFLNLVGAYDHFWMPVLFQVLCAALFYVGWSGRISKGIWAGVAAVLAFGISGYLYYVTVIYRPFLGYLPLIAAYVGLGLVFLWWLISLGPGFIPLDNKHVRFVVRLVMPVLAVVGFGIGYGLNLYFNSGIYVTLHLSLLEALYLLLGAGLASLAVAIPKIQVRPRVWQLLIIAGLFLVFYLAPPAAATEWCNKARPHFLEKTILGQSYVLGFSGNTNARNRLNSIPKVKVPVDPQAIGRFAANNNLPLLPANFRLEKYNILHISMEATRFDETSFASAKKKTTPRLLDFAQKGNFWFSRAYTGAPCTFQSMSSIMSMTFPSAIKLSIDEKPWYGKLHSEVNTVAELLTTVGYETFWAGHNYKRNFSKSIRGLQQGFKVKNLVYSRDPKVDEKILAKAIASIDRIRKTDKRFYGWVFFESPHPPFSVHYDNMASKTERDRYRQEIRHGDEVVGKLLDHLDKADIMKDTVVIFHADHGETFRVDRGHHGHANIHQEVTRVPLVIHIPGVKGKKMSEPTSLTYLFPWLFLKGPPVLKAAASERLHKEIGPMMKQTDGAVVIEMLWNNRMTSSLVTKNYRYVYNFWSGFSELYDLKRDWREKRNVFGTSAALGKSFFTRFSKYLQVRETNQHFGVLKKSKPKPKTKKKPKRKPPRLKPKPKPTAKPGATPPASKKAVK
jgi:arylsulfatase A-like enzyme